MPQRARSSPPTTSGSLPLADGSRIAVIGGGPAGSFFSIFVLDMAARVGLDVHVDIYEQKEFSQQGPPGCNMCGGIVSESLVQHLAAEGIALPPTVVQRGIDSYMLHMDVGRVRIGTPFDEKRIASVFRGLGPRNEDGTQWASFDAFLLGLAEERGARLIRRRIEKTHREEDGRPAIPDGHDGRVPYDLLVIATGVNGATPELLSGLGLSYRPPRLTKTAIREYRLGRARVLGQFGSSMQVFLLNIPRLEFAAFIPKGDYVTLCMLGEDIDKQLLESFLDAPEVAACMSQEWSSAESACKCAPRMNVGGAVHPFGERVLLVGDAGISRLYKDGIGAAYRTAKAAARAVVFHGVSDTDLRRSFWPSCRAMEKDNQLGHLLFQATGLVQKSRWARRALYRMVAWEQADRQHRAPRMSGVFWDMFTGSASYANIVQRGLHPALVAHLCWELLRASFVREPRVAAALPATGAGV